jgi:hypothetical protein
MSNNKRFSQFSMFNLKLASNDILYWENALSYSNELSKFIEIVDTHKDSYFKISKWENLKKIINIDKIKESTGTDILDKKVLYIVNSFSMGFEMCFDRYCKSKAIDSNQYILDLNNIIIKKNNKNFNIDLEDKVKDNVVFLVIAYINDDYEGGEIFLNKSLLTKPKAGTVLIIPTTEINNYEVNNNILGTRYIAYTTVYKKKN